MKRVETIAFMKTSVNAVASCTVSISTPAGRRLSHSASSAFTRLTTARAFASGVLYTERTIASLPFMSDLPE